MELTTTYRKVLVMLVLLFAGWASCAQTNVVVGSTRTFKVPVHENGHKFEWRVYDATDTNRTTPLKLKNDNGVITIDGTTSIDFITTDNFSLTCSIEGDYIIEMTEFNRAQCTRDAEFNLKVNPIPLQIDFVEGEYYEVVNETREGFDIPFEITTDEDIEWKNKYLEKVLDKGVDVSLRYTYYSEEGKKKENTVIARVDVKRDVNNKTFFDFKYDIDFITAWRESNDSDHYFEFEISEVKDSYGALIKQGVKPNKYIFGAYKKPGVTKINHKK